MVNRPVSRGDVYLIEAKEARQTGESQSVLVSMDGQPIIDDEAETKKRPVVVVSRDELNRGDYVLAVPFYSQQLDRRRQMRYCVFFSAGESGLNRDCVAKCDEVSQIDKMELPLLRGPIGRVLADKMTMIVDAIRYCIRDHTVDQRTSQSQ